MNSNKKMGTPSDFNETWYIHTMGSEDMDFAIQVGAIINMPACGPFHTNLTFPKWGDLSKFNMYPIISKLINRSRTTYHTKPCYISYKLILVTHLGNTLIISYFSFTYTK